MPQLNGVDAARQVLKQNPDQAVLVHTAVDSEQVIRECLEAGVRGWVFKSDASEDVTAAVEALQRQKTIFSARVSDLVVDGHKRHRADPAKGVTRLSPREREVVQLVSEGKSSKDVAIILNVTLATAETHRSNILKKLRLHSIAELVLYAVRNGIIQVHVPPPSFSNSERNDVRTRALTDSVPHPMPENGRTSVAP